jgi:type II secretory pathway pseudopilin PulG
VTLVELLVSMAVASILMTALLQALTSASDSWTKQSRTVGAQREGRAAMRILSDDLQAMVTILPSVRRLSDVTIGSEEPNPGEVSIGGLVPWEERPDQAADNRTGFWLDSGEASGQNSRLAFLRCSEGTARSGDLGRGDLRLVLYAAVVSRDPAASGLSSPKLTQKLIRRVLGPAETHNRLRAALAMQQPIVTDEDWVRIMDAPVTGSGTTVSVVAHDVVTFKINGFDDLLLERFAVPVLPSQAPKWMDVTLRLTNSQTSQWLETEADWRGEGSEGSRLTKGTPDVFRDDVDVRTYVMRTALPGGF